LELVHLLICGGHRTSSAHQPKHHVRTASLQANLDQLHWTSGSLEESFAAVESLAFAVAPQRPGWIVCSESALLCYIDRQPANRRRIMALADSLGIPVLFGALHWDPAPAGSRDRYHVYNTAFVARPGQRSLDRYFKMKLVPFSEALPFEGLFPLLSRVNLGEADFKSGRDPVVFTAAEARAVPLICYEIIYPGFVRSRAVGPANVLVNITNDGWFGRTNGPFHHAAMARMRCIENGISLIRCANSGISLFADQYGRCIGKTGLYQRTAMVADVPVDRVKTFYTRAGDWPVGASLMIAVVFLLAQAVGWTRKRRSAA